MRRLAIFVEGQTELIFVREFLLKWFDYQIDIECRTLFTANDLNRAEYDCPNLSAFAHVQIINVGMDGNVLTRILNREKYLINAGYEKIIGLRDMYSRDYRDIVKNKQVDIAVNDKFIQGTRATIQDKSKFPDRINFCFAIMELEAWWLGVPSLWDSLDSNTSATHQGIFNKPESVFHPAVLVDMLFQSRGMSYSKSKGDVEAILSKLFKEHFAELHESQRCPSFCEFVNYIQTL